MNMENLVKMLYDKEESRLKKLYEEWLEKEKNHKHDNNQQHNHGGGGMGLGGMSGGLGGLKNTLGR